MSTRGQIRGQGARPPVETIDLTDVARLSLPNVFEQVNTLPGVRLGARIVEGVDAYQVTVLDYTIIVPATTGPVTVTLPLGLGTGQIYRIKRDSSSSYPVTVETQPGDTINGDSSVVLDDSNVEAILYDIDLGLWDRQSGLTGDFAKLSVANVFTDVNTFNGIRLISKTVAVDYVLTPQDAVLLVNAAGGPITIFLPPSNGQGQSYWISKADGTDEIATIQADGTDLIDDSTSLNFTKEGASVQVIDAEVGVWRTIGVKDALVLPDDPPVMPETLNGVIALLKSYGLCAP